MRVHPFSRTVHTCKRACKFPGFLAKTPFSWKRENVVVQKLLCRVSLAYTISPSHLRALLSHRLSLFLSLAPAFFSGALFPLHYLTSVTYIYIYMYAYIYHSLGRVSRWDSWRKCNKIVHARARARYFLYGDESRTLDQLRSIPRATYNRRAPLCSRTPDSILIRDRECSRGSQEANASSRRVLITLASRRIRIDAIFSHLHRTMRRRLVKHCDDEDDEP